MTTGVLLPVASLMSTIVWVGLFVLAALTAGASLYFFTRARHREAQAPARDAETSRAVAEMRTLGDRIETIVSQQQLQGETQRARLGQQIEDVQQTVQEQRHHVDGLRNELRHEVQKRDAELEAIRKQLTDIQASGAALPPAAEPKALPAPAPAPAPALPRPAPTPTPSASPAPTPAAGPAAPAPLTANEPSGDSFAGAEAVPPRDPFADALPLDPPAPPAPAPPVATVAQPSAPAFAEPPAPAPPFASVFSEMGFDAFAPGEPAGEPFAPLPSPPPPAGPAQAPPAGGSQPPAAPAPAAPAPAAPAPAAPPQAADAFEPTPSAPPVPNEASAPDGGAWIAAARAPQPSALDAWDVAPVEPAAAPDPLTAAPALPAEPNPAAPEPAVPQFVTPPGADDFLFISTIDEDVQRALYMAGVTKLEEMAHWSRSDARRIGGEVGVSEETIMNQWVFEAQGALFERYSSGVGG